MFIGHYAVAMGAKRFTPRVSLGALVLATQFADLLWPIFLLLGWEQVRISPGLMAFSSLDFVHYPLTHSLLGEIVWGAVLGLIYFAFTKYRMGAWLVGILVPSHWVLDAIVHRPDLPLVPWSPIRVGLGLWNSVPGTLVVELGLYVVGAYLYIRNTTAKDKVGRYGFWALVLLLLVIYLADVFGPPPPTEHAIAIAGLAGWLVVVWAYWADAHRVATSGRA